MKRQWTQTTGSNYRLKEVMILDVSYRGEIEANVQILIHQEADMEIPTELVYDMGCGKENGVWKVT